MSACEKCWHDAKRLAALHGGSQVEIYVALIIERQDNVCSPKEQAGQWWSDELKIDVRLGT